MYVEDVMYVPYAKVSSISYIYRLIQLRVIIEEKSQVYFQRSIFRNINGLKKFKHCHEKYK